MKKVALLFGPYNKTAVIIALALGMAFWSGCKDEDEPAQQPDEQPQVQTDVPPFNADSAYFYIERQVAFGPRVPGTESHQKTVEWMAAKLAEYAGAANVQVQEAPAEIYDGTKITIKNVIASFHPERKLRILLCAHYDTRKVADHDTEQRDVPIAGANDGGSGVGVLLEIARQLRADPLQNLGVDIVLFDAEDQGIPDNMGFDKGRDSYLTWALGSQYWSKNRHNPAQNFQYGILLDMVGAEDAVFPQEGYSVAYAGHVVKKVWNQAYQLGHGNYFLNRVGPELIDDHLFVNEYAGIPTIDIIHYNTNTNSFGEFWHTHDDDMDVISRKTLHAVGETVLTVLYKEDVGAI